MFHRSSLARALAVAIVFAATSLAAAQPKPFSVIGAGLVEYVPLPGDLYHPKHFAIGTATTLGTYYGEGRVQTDRFTGPTTGEFHSAVPFVFGNLKGDRLACTYGDVANGAAQPGQVEIFPQDDGRFIAVWLAEFVPVPALCTGKFKGVKGSFMMLAVSEPFVVGDTTTPVAYAWIGSGRFTYAKPK